MALDAGARLGPYEILGPLGAGGMGEVYRARDTRLDRLVAVKVARERFSERFEREARTIAQLNHPHICTLHDVGADYLVMELIEGDTLAARLRKGPIDVSAAMRIAAQIAEALAAAHAKRIVHRDLKPQNIMLTRKGVKVLDFGLATVPHDETHTATVAVMGTPAYMAPEQREGGPVDARSDHYALGLVLLEMITGRRPDPMEPRIPDDLPPLASRTIARCLARNPEDRWQSATDLASVLDQLAAGAAQPRAAAERRPIAWVALAAGLILVVAAVIGAMSWTRPAAAPRPLRFTIPPPEGTTFPTVSVGGAPAVAPDGQLIAFVAEGSDGRRLWVRSLEAVDARPLPGTDGAANPAWSSDGRSLTFFAGGSLQRVGLDGQPPRPLTENPVGAGGAAWNDHGQIVWSNGAVLRTIPAGGGEAADVTERDTRLLEENHYAPAFLPDGKHYLVLVRAGADLRYTLCVGELGDPTSRQVLLSGVSSARFAPSASGGPGSLLFVRDGRLLAQPFDADRLAFIGEPHAVADRVATHSFGIIGDFSASANVLAYRVSDPPTQELVWFDRTGRPVGGIGDRPGNRRNNVQLSPDGRSVAFVRETSGVQDVWIADLERGTPARFTFDGGRSPVWSPDGSEIAYLSGDAIVRKPVAGGSEVVVWKGAGILALNDWSGDGRHFLLTRWDPSQGMKGRGLWLLSTGGLNEPPVPTLFEAGGLHGQFAPAAGPPRWVAYDGAGTWVRQMPGSGDGKWQVAERSNAVRWRPDGRELFFIRLLDFVSVQVEDGKGPGFRHSAPQPLFVAPPALRVAMSQYALGYDVAADGQRFLATFPTRETPSAVIDVVLNWQSALADSRTTK